MPEGWRKLAAAASQEKDSEKLRALIDEVIRALGQEQKQVREEIEGRIRRHVRDMEIRPPPPTPCRTHLDDFKTLHRIFTGLLWIRPSVRADFSSQEKGPNAWLGQHCWQYFFVSTNPTPKETNARRTLIRNAF